MTTLPIPFISAFLILMLAASNHHQLKETPTGKVFALVLYLNALSMILIGLRWSRDWVAVLPVVATLSIVSTALLYLAFCSLGRKGPVLTFSRDWLHLIPPVVVYLCMLLAPKWVDLTLVCLKILYVYSLLQLARRLPDSLQLVRLSWFGNTQQALWGAVILLLISTAVDLGIAVDFAFYEGRHAANLVGTVSLAIVLLLAWISVMAARGRVNEHGVQQTAQPATTTEKQPIEDAKLVEKLNRLLIDEKLYADTELNLQRMARKSGIPARQISRAINAQTGLNISQWVNSARIDAACRQLTNTATPINEAMFAAGFLTKSNFNREFRRLKGCSPSEWRLQQKP